MGEEGRAYEPGHRGRLEAEAAYRGLVIDLGAAHVLHREHAPARLGRDDARHVQPRHVREEGGRALRVARLRVRIMDRVRLRLGARVRIRVRVRVMAGVGVRVRVGVDGEG